MIQVSDMDRDRERGMETGENRTSKREEIQIEKETHST